MVYGRLHRWNSGSAWFMIEAFGAVRTSILCGMIPIGLSLLVPGALTRTATNSTESSGKKSGQRLIPMSLIVAAVALLFVCKSPYDRESRYFSLAVGDDVIDGRKVRVLVLDRLVHSAIDLDDPSFLHYPHDRIQGDFTRAAARDARAAGRTPAILVIGGGGYVRFSHGQFCFVVYALNNP